MFDKEDLCGSEWSGRNTGKEGEVAGWKYTKHLPVARRFSFLTHAHSIHLGSGLPGWVAPSPFDTGD